MCIVPDCTLWQTLKYAGLAADAGPDAMLSSCENRRALHMASDYALGRLHVDYF